MRKHREHFSGISHPESGLSRREFVVIAATVSVSLSAFLAACQQAGTTGKKGAVDTETLLIAMAATPGNIDHEKPNEASSEALAAVMETPLTWALVSGSQDPSIMVPNFQMIQGNLAESWDLSSDGRTLTLHLKKGVKSFYGNELTAKDIKWNWDRSGSDAGVLGGFFDNVMGMAISNPGKSNAEATGVKVIDDYTVSETLNKANTMFLPMETLIYWRAPFDSTEAKKHATPTDPWASTWIGTNGCGFGAFGVQTWEPGNQVVLVRNDNYFKGRPKLKKVIMKAVAEASNRSSSLAAGSVDVAENLQYRDLADLSKRSGVKVHQHSGNQWIQVVLNNRVAPFTDVRVRQALNYATPRDAIKQSVFAGYAIDSTGPVTAGYADYVSQGTWPYDLDKARALLAAAGHANGFSETLTYNGDIAAEEQIAQILQTEYAKVGVKLTLNKVATAVWNDMYFGHKASMIFGDEQALVPIAAYQMFIYYAKNAPAGVAGYANDDASQKIYAGFTELDATARATLMKDAQGIIWNDCPWIWGWYVGWQLATRDYVQGARWYEANVAGWAQASIG